MTSPSAVSPQSPNWNQKSQLENPFKTSIQEIEAKFKNFGTATPADKEELVALLKKAYSELRSISSTGTIPPALKAEAARLFSIYGRCLYSQDMPTSSRMSQLGLALHLVSLNILDERVIPSFAAADSLTDLMSILPEPKSLYALQMDTANEVFLAKITEQTSTQWFEVAKTLRWMGHAWQNINTIAVAKELPRFEKIYGLCQAICTQLDTNDSRFEIAELIYNTSRYIYGLKNPDEKNVHTRAEARLALLDTLRPFLEKEGKSTRAQQLRAQISNITMMENDPVIKATTDPEVKRNLLIKSFAKVSEARAIAEETQGINTFLKTLFLNNKARVAMLCLEAGCKTEEVVTMQLIGLWFDEVLSDIKSSRYNFYFPGFVMNAVRYSIAQKDIPTAEFRLGLAKQLLIDNPNAKDQEDLAKLEAQLKAL